MYMLQSSAHAHTASCGDGRILWHIHIHSAANDERFRHRLTLWIVVDRLLTYRAGGLGRTPPDSKSRMAICRPLELSTLYHNVTYKRPTDLALFMIHGKKRKVSPRV